MSKMIKRHNKSAIFMHWFNAICWILLLFTGFAILDNPKTQPIGMWWVDFWNGMFSNGAVGLLEFHIILAITWISVYILYILLFLRKDILPFLKQIFITTPIRDMEWCIRKALWLILGEKMMVKLNINPKLPEQGFYNAGQKFVAILAVLSSLALVGSGIVLTLAYFNYFEPLVDIQNIIQQALLTHMISAGLMAIAIPVHIYMAAFAPGEGPALKSMFTGYVSEDFIKHHNPLWYKKLKSKEL